MFLGAETRVQRAMQWKNKIECMPFLFIVQRKRIVTMEWNVSLVFVFLYVLLDRSNVCRYLSLHKRRVQNSILIFFFYSYVWWVMDDQNHWRRVHCSLCASFQCLCVCVCVCLCHLNWFYFVGSEINSQKKNKKKKNENYKYVLNWYEKVPHQQFWYFCVTFVAVVFFFFLCRITLIQSR